MAHIKKEKITRKKYQNFIIRFYWLVIILVFLGAISIEYFFIIKPKLAQTFNGGPLDAQSRQIILQEQEKYYEGLKELEKQAEGINRAEFKKIDYIVAKHIGVPDVLKQIGFWGKQEGVELTNFSFGFEKGVVIITLHLDTENYQNIKQYLSKIEKNARIMDVTSLSLKDMGTSFTLKFQNYYLE